MSNRDAAMHRSPLVAIVSRLVSACLLVAVMTSIATAQTPYTSFGRRFLVAFPDTTQSQVRVLYNMLEATVSLSLVSLDTASVTVSAPGFVRSVTVYPDRTTSVVLTQPPLPAKIFVDSLNTPLPTSFDVRSDRPIAVTAYFATIHGAEAFTPMPVEQWGREYFAASLNQWFVYNARAIEEKYSYDAAPAAALIIASEDNTEVTIASRTAIVGPSIRTITLNAGQVYLIETDVPLRLDSLAIPDLSGTHISATKPIGVISGNTRTLGSTDNPIPADPLPTNSMSNTAYEWLHPVDDHGHTFVYRQFSTVDEINTTELVRVYATAPGMTTVTTTNGGPPMGVLQGEFLEFSSKAWRQFPDRLQPFAVRTDKPAQTFVVTASSAAPIGGDPTSGLEMETQSWSPAMAELVPRERWITLGRYNAPSYPGGLANYVVLAADSGTTVLLDGEPVTFDSVAVTGTTYRHARVAVAAGDHTLRAIGGRFTATAFGQLRGYAAFRPFGTNGGDDADGGVAHPTYYFEILSVAYATPVPGISDLTHVRDSLEITRIDRCDSSIVTANRLGVTWSSSIVDATIDPGGRNVDIEIAKTFASRLHLGFRIRFRPVDPTQDAGGSVTVRNEAGQLWTIPYSYRAHTVALTPAQVDLLAIAPGELQTIPLTLANQKPFTTTVLDVRLRDGSQGFVLSGREVLPKPLAAGGSFGLTLTFIGTVPGRHYVDTLVIVADCDSMLVPLSARMAPPDPAPVPLITGYDWGVRRVGSVNDTLSFISNAGTLPFTVARVEIIDDPAGAFALVDPPVAAVPVVDPAARHAIGIRFTPPSVGSFVSTILLITTEDDSARGVLSGSALLATIDVDDLLLAELCIGRALDTAVTVRASGSAPTRIDSFVVTAPAGFDIALDTASMGLPRTLLPGETVELRMHVTGTSAGAFDATVVAIAASIGDSVARISGVLVACTSPEITATDHDFGDVLITRARDGAVYVVNTGEGDVTVTTAAIVDDAEAAFRLVGPSAPFVVRERDSVRVDVTFTPPTVGPKSARLEYRTTAGTVHSRLSGVGVRLVVPARIPRYYRGDPGEERVFAVNLDSSFDVRDVGPIPVTVDYDSNLLDFLGLRDTASTQTALRLIASAPGRISFELLPRGDSLTSGPIAGLRFLVRIATADSSELPLTVESPAPWLSFSSSPGLFVRNPWCGLTMRLFEFTGSTLELRPVQPNPVRDDARVEFSIPLDGATTLVIVDALGVEWLRLIDGVLGAGGYTASMPSGSLASGVYFVRLTSSGMQRVERFVVE
jgi:hypothetical protein